MRLKSVKGPVRSIAVSALCALLLVACGASPESMIQSAKDYIAKNDRGAAMIQLKNALQKEPNQVEARFLLGKLSLEQNDYASAEKELSRALSLGFPADEIVPLLGRALLNTDQGARILTEFPSITLQTPAARASAQAFIGLAQAQQGKRQLAAEAFEQALKEVPGFPLARISLIRMNSAGRELTAILEDAESVLKTDPQLPEGLAMKAELLAGMNRRDEAIKTYDALIKARPLDPSAYQAVFMLLMRDNRKEEAQARISDMKKSLGNHPLAIYLQALIDVRDGKSGEAYEQVLQVLRVAPDYVPALMLASTLQLQNGNFIQARENLTKVLEASPANQMARRMLVSAYLGLREPSKSLEQLQPLLKEGASDDVAILNLAGQTYAMNGDFARSEEYFSRAAKADPKNASFRTRLGVSRLAAGETAQGLEDLALASSLDPDNIQADITLVMAHLRRNELDKAMAAVKVLEKKRPEDPVTFNLKGGVLLASKDQPGARAAFEKALALKVDFLPALSNLARLDVTEKKTEAAHKRYETFLAANPKNAQAYLQFAELQALTGTQAREVQATLEKGLAQDPASLPLRIALSRLLIQAGESKRALLLAQEAAASSADDPAVLDLLGRAQVAAGELQQALTTYGKLSARVPRNPAPLVAMGDIQLVTKDFQSAEQSLRKALAITPDMLQAQQRLIAVLVNAKRTDAALVVVKDVQKQRKTSPVGYLLEGEVLAAAGRKVEAVGALEQALKLDKGVNNQMRLYAARKAANQNQEADRQAADWIRSNPKDMVFRGFLAEQALGAGNYAAAVQVYRQMSEIAPKNAMVLNNLAWALGKMKDANALATAERALALSPNSAVILDTLGVLQVDSGETAKGVETLRRAVSLGPKLPQLRVNLARALIGSGDKNGARKELDEADKNAAGNPVLRAEIERLRATL